MIIFEILLFFVNLELIQVIDWHCKIIIFFNFFIKFKKKFVENQVFLILGLHLTVSVYSLILFKIIEKTCKGPTNIFKMPFGKFEFFSFF